MTTDFVRDILESEHPPLVHVGYPKALSSWLQGPLFQPDNGFAKVMGPLEVRMTLVAPPPLQFNRDHLRELNRDDLHEYFTSLRSSQGPFRQTIPVITSEGLVGNRSTGGHDAKLLADRLLACFATARVLIVVREQQTMLRALYGNLVYGRGYPHSIARLFDPISPEEVPQTTPAYLQYDTLVSYYRQCFGAERVLVLPYELFLEDPSAFAGRIASFAGGPAAAMDVERLPTDQVVNRGKGLTALTAMRMVSKLVFKTPFDPRGIIRADHPGFRPWRIRAIDRLDRMVPASLDRWVERRFARYVATQASGQFRASNRRLAEMMDTDLARYGYEM